MAINFTCLCGKKLQIADQYAGTKGQCPACGKVVDIPLRDEYLEPAYVTAEAVEVPPAPWESARDREEVPAPWEGDDPGQRVPTEQIYEPRPEEVHNHNGRPLPRQVDFFAEPPREIGPLVSAYSTLRRGKKPWSGAGRLAWVLFACGAGLLLGVFLALATRTYGLAWLGLVFALGGGLLSFALTRFAHVCTYVGRDGVARFRCSGNRHNLTEKIFLFRDATELRTSQTRHYYNGVYTGTHYSFVWTDVNKLKVFALAGSYRSQEGNPAAKDPYHFAVSAELAWSLYLLDQVQPQLTSGGSVKFSLRGGDWIRVGPGYLVLSIRGKKIELGGQDIARVRIDQGVVSILEPDAHEGWFSSTGVYKFAYNELANAQFFLFLMDKLIGVKTSG